ncbi:MAG TPA: PaaI family thioesterase [Kribbellaceae bacterium]
MTAHAAVDGGPERLFGFQPIHDGGRRVGGAMSTGAWLTGPGAVPRAGGLGVLVDNVLGNAILAGHPGHWSVSTEIGIDVTGTIPADGSTVRARARSVDADAAGAFATGDVIDASGNVIARCRQRGRFVMPPSAPSAPSPPTPAATNGSAGVRRERGTAALMSRIGAVTSLAGDGDDLELLSTPALANPMGNLHGGVTLCVSEWTGARALGRAAAPLTTASVHVAYLRPVPVGSRVRFTTHVVHAGRSLGVARVTGRDDAGRACTVTTLVTH